MKSSAPRAPRTSPLARSAIAGVAGARLGVARVRQRWLADNSTAAAQQHEAEVGRILMAAMTQLRGTALKAAQVLSQQLGIRLSP